MGYQDVKNYYQTEQTIVQESVLNRNQQYYVKCNAYKILLHICLKKAKFMYFNQLFEANRDPVSNLWKTLKPIINPRQS